MRTLLTNLIAVCLVLTSAPATPAEAKKTYDLEVNFATPSREFQHFWRSTGFSPGELLLTQDMLMTTRMIQASRGPAIQYIRPHYLLDLVDLSEAADGSLSVNWTRLDAALDVAVKHGLRLFFELMRSPGKPFDDFRNLDQVRAWRSLTQQLAEHLMQRYGRDTVESWYFETTNESDIHPFWPQGTQAFLNYYDASSEGLRAANPRLRFGGPGIGRFLSPTLKQLLEHCDTGTNVLTQEKGVRLDFISFHQKSLPHETVRLSEHVIDYVRQYHPRFANLPFINNEADAAGGWGIPYWWQAGSWPAAFGLQSIDLHHEILIGRLQSNFELLGPDHGFLGSWGKRTLAARILPGDDDAEQWGSSDPGGWKPWDQDADARPKTSRFYLIRKPAMTVMSLASLLGKQRYSVSGFPALEKRIDTYTSSARHLGCIATSRADSIIVIACYNAPPLSLENKVEGDGMVPANNQTRRLLDAASMIRLRLQGLEFQDARLLTWQIDPDRGNPYATFVRLGSPDVPTVGQAQELVRTSEPVRLDTRSLAIAAGETQLQLDMPGAGVTVVALVPAAARRRPAPATDFVTTRFTGANGEDMTYVSWTTADRDGFTFARAEYAAPGESRFRRLDDGGLLDHGVTVVGSQPGGRLRVVYENAFGDLSRASILTLPK